MAWIETVRGTVYRWEVDHVDHFTVAYYFARFQEATASLLEAAGLAGDADPPGSARCRVERCHVRYVRELRAGDLFHIRSGVAAAAADSLTLVHEVYDSGDGALCTTVEQRARLVGGDGTGRERMDAHRVQWEPPPGGPPTPAWPEGDRGFVESARDRIRPADVDAGGQATWSAYVHRFSAANGHAIAAFGMTPAYMRRERRGFSTFEFRLDLGGALRVGDHALVRSGVLHVGKSSLRLLHRLTNARTGEPVATLEQAGVHLDLAGRRPAPLPEALRERARRLLAGPA
jgi:acyl-CoA thioesterase FadM